MIEVWTLVGFEAIQLVNIHYAIKNAITLEIQIEHGLSH